MPEEPVLHPRFTTQRTAAPHLPPLRGLVPAILLSRLTTCTMSIRAGERGKREVATTWALTQAVPSTHTTICSGTLLLLPRPSSGYKTLQASVAYSTTIVIAEGTYDQPHRLPDRSASYRAGDVQQHNLLLRPVPELAADPVTCCWC